MHHRSDTSATIYGTYNNYPSPTQTQKATPQKSDAPQKRHKKAPQKSDAPQWDVACNLRSERSVPISR